MQYTRHKQTVSLSDIFPYPERGYVRVSASLLEVLPGHRWDFHIHHGEYGRLQDFECLLYMRCCQCQAVTAAKMPGNMPQENRMVWRDFIKICGQRMSFFFKAGIIVTETEDSFSFGGCCSFVAYLLFNCGNVADIAKRERFVKHLF